MSLPSNAAVMLIVHGTVDDPADMREFLLRIRRGRPASDELVAELVSRYREIGGSPLLETTRRQASALARELGCRVLVGTRFWRPLLETALEEAVNLGVERLALVPVAPFSVAIYCEAARQAAAGLGEQGVRLPQLCEARPWGELPQLVAAQATAIEPFLRAHPGAALVLTAHSLPTRVIRAGDGYASEVEACAAAIAAELGVEHSLAYQSQGADGGDWLGPTLWEALEALAHEGRREVVLAPIGFLTDHVETLYDLDVEARRRAEGLGLALHRVGCLNESPALVEALRYVALRAFEGAGARG